MENSREFSLIENRRGNSMEKKMEVHFERIKGPCRVEELRGG